MAGRIPFLLSLRGQWPRQSLKSVCAKIHIDKSIFLYYSHSWRIVIITIAKAGKRIKMKNINFNELNIYAKKRIQYPPVYPLNNKSTDLTFQKNNMKSNLNILYPGGYV